MPQIEDIKVGDTLSFWHDAGINMQLVYARVLKIGAKKIKVRDERGTEGWKYPFFFLKVVPEHTVAELVAEGTLDLRPKEER